MKTATLVESPRRLIVAKVADCMNTPELSRVIANSVLNSSSTLFYEVSYGKASNLDKGVRVPYNLRRDEGCI
jgi:hypothetical protein